MIVFKPPDLYELAAGATSVFLAGSIETGTAEDWQAGITARLADLDVAILNPRRDEWDSTWRQSLDDPQFRAQVEWELDGLDRASVIALWFAPTTRAPISLLELGLTARSGRVVVGCPDGFWRKGNVEVVCARYGIPLFPDFGAFVGAVRARIRVQRPALARRP
jgi:Nucleoside 2-deoxyribosyltransferase like